MQTFPFRIGRTIVIGRRAAVLLLLGTVFIAYGLAIGYGGPPTGTFLDGACNPWFTAVPWLVGGGLATFTGVTHPRREWLGFASLFAVPALWVGVYVISMVGPWHPPRAVFGAIVWLLVAGLVLLLAGWPDPPANLPRDPSSTRLTPPSDRTR